MKYVDEYRDPLVVEKIANEINKILTKSFDSPFG